MVRLGETDRVTSDIFLTPIKSGVELITRVLGPQTKTSSTGVFVWLLN